jgi:hypothetical protein
MPDVLPATFCSTRLNYRPQLERRGTGTHAVSAALLTVVADAKLPLSGRRV